MEVILYLIGVILVLLSIELLILIIEVVKLSSSIQSFIYTRGSEPHRDTIDNSTLVSLLSKLHLAPHYDEKHTPSSTHVQGPEQEENLAPATKNPEDSTDSTKPQSVDQNINSEETSEETFEPETPPSAARRPVGTPPVSLKKSNEIETKTANFNIRKCPECGRENSSFRKECFYCNTPLTE